MAQIVISGVIATIISVLILHHEDIRFMMEDFADWLRDKRDSRKNRKNDSRDQ